MVRKGRKAVETPSGWYDVIRGPRPPSHRWPLATQWRPRQPAALEFRPQVQPGLPAKEGGNGFKLNPDEKCAAAQLKVQRLEAALAAFGDESSPEKEASKDSSPSSICGGAVKVVRGVFGAIAEEVGRGAGRSGTHKSKVGQIERGSDICPVDVTPDLQAEAEAQGEAPEERPHVRQRVTEPRRGVETMRGSSFFDMTVADSPEDDVPREVSRRRRPRRRVQDSDGATNEEGSASTRAVRRVVFP